MLSAVSYIQDTRQTELTGAFTLLRKPTLVIVSFFNITRNYPIFPQLFSLIYYFESRKYLKIPKGAFYDFFSVPWDKKNSCKNCETPP